MSLVAAKCTQCGANIEVDESKDAGICRCCGTAFVTQKVIQNISNNFNVNSLDNIQFGDYLKILRQQQNLSQKALAEKLNVTNKAISKWENNRGYPDIANLKAIAAFFELSLDKLTAHVIPAANSLSSVEITVPFAFGEQNSTKKQSKKRRSIIYFAAIASLITVLALAAIFLPPLFNKNPSTKNSQLFRLKTITVKTMFTEQYTIDPDEPGDNADQLALALLYSGRTVQIFSDKILFNVVTACGAKNPAYYSKNNNSVIFADDELKSLINDAEIIDGKFVFSINTAFLSYLYEYILS